MSGLEQVSHIVKIMSSLALTIGVVIALFQFHFLRKQHRSVHEWNRRSKAFEYSFSDDPEMLQVLTRLDAHLEISTKKNCELSLADIKAKKETYPQIQHDIHFALARLEYMCTAIKQKVADEEICRDLLENRTISFFRFFRQYIEDTRELRGSQAIMKNLEDYANKWSSSRPINSRKSTDE